MLILAERHSRPLHEMLSMKLPAETFEACANCEKNKNKRDRKLSFLLAGIGATPQNKKNCLKRGTN